MRSLVGAVAVLAVVGCSAGPVPTAGVAPAPEPDVAVRAPVVERAERGAPGVTSMEHEPVPDLRGVRTDAVTGARGALAATPEDAQGRARRLQANVATAEELFARLRPHVSRSAEGLKPVEGADGRLTYDVEGRFQHAMVMKRGSDGSIGYECVESVAGAARALGVGLPGGETR